MKKSYFLWYLISVILIVGVCDIIFSISIEKIMDNKYTPQINLTNGANSKIAVIGASRAQHHYVPSIIADSLDMSVYNYGIDGRNILIHYTVLESLINNSEKKPEMVILDLNKTDICDMPSWNTERLNILYPYYNSNIYARQTLDDLLNEKELIALKSSGLIRHNSELISDLKVLVNENKTTNDKNNGYVPLYSSWEKELESDEDLNEKTHDQKIKYLEKFIKRCKEENIKLIIAVSPAFVTPTNSKWIKEIKKISDRENVSFFDMHAINIFLDHKEWFSDPYHLNDTGAKIYTNYIIKQLRD